MDTGSQTWGKNIHASLGNRPFPPPVTQNDLILNPAAFSISRAGNPKYKIQMKSKAIRQGRS
jgi:hypothetical protein